MSLLESTLALHIRADKLPEPIRELSFAKPRKWRFDFSWPHLMLAVEVEGGTWSGGRHTTGKGFEQDCEKYNQAVLLGWSVLRFTGSQVLSGHAINIIKHAMEVLPCRTPMKPD